MKARQVILRILLPGIALWAVLWACNTPSIPNPPPGSEVITFLQEEENYWRFFMDSNEYIDPGTPITIENKTRQTWVGGLVTPDGTFLSMPFYGELDDIIQMTFGDSDNGGSMCYILASGNSPAEDPRCGN